MKSSLVLLLFSFANLANSANVRFYLAYGSVDLASINGGSVGGEIGSNLRVLPGASFKVQLWMELQSAEPTRISNWSTNLAFDQSRRAEGEPGLSLDSSAYRKIFPASVDLPQCVSNYARFPSFSSQGIPQDRDLDGVQDTGAWEPLNEETFNLYGTGGAAGVFTRPVGLGATIRGINQDVRELSYAFFTTGHFRLWDYDLRNSLAPGESFGTNGNETGLQVWTDHPWAQNASTWFAPSSAHTFSGSRYNILAVPEPPSLFALGLGLLCLRKRK
jgi:hypothetical protein